MLASNGCKTAWLIHLLLIFQFLSFGSAFPLEFKKTGSKNAILSKRVDWEWKLEDLNNEFKGILWDEAFKNCETEQLNKIIFATRAAMWMLELPRSNGAFTYSAAWNRYFGDYPIWFKNGPKSLEAAAHIQRQLSDYYMSGVNLLILSYR